VGGKDLLAAKVAGGKVIMRGTGEDSAGAYTPTPGWRNAVWLRRMHVAVASQIAVIAAWLAIIFGMMATFYITWLPYFVSASMEKWILLAHLLSVAVLRPPVFYSKNCYSPGQHVRLSHSCR
jgi:hypothetical protein